MSANERDLALSEAQEAVHVERFAHKSRKGGTVGGPDSFYNGMRHAESIIAGLRTSTDAGIVERTYGCCARCAREGLPTFWSADYDAWFCEGCRADPNGQKQMRVVSASDGTLYAVTDDTSIWQSTDKGETWTPAPTCELPRGEVPSLFIDHEDRMTALWKDGRRVDMVLTDGRWVPDPGSPS